MTLPRGKAAFQAAVSAEPTDLRNLVREAVLSLEAAVVAAEMVALHGISESLSFERLNDLLTEALSATRKADDTFGATPVTIFPNVSLAQEWCERHPLAAGRSYGIHPDGMGRCSISISQIVGYL
jgi:hypothetical protein